IYDRAVNIGDGHLGVMTPDWFGPENFFRLQVLQRELKALPLLVPLADGLSSDHHDVLENLFSQIPMLCSGTSGDVGRRKKRRYKNAGIVENAFGAECVDRCGDIGAGPDPVQPALLAPACEALGGLDTRNRERLCHIGDVDYVSRSGENLLQLSAAMR